QRGADLLAVRQTGSLPRLLAGLGEYREQNRSQDRDNGDHHEQLDQRKTMRAISPMPHGCTLLSVSGQYYARSDFLRTYPPEEETTLRWDRSGLYRFAEVLWSAVACYALAKAACWRRICT